MGSTNPMQVSDFLRPSSLGGCWIHWTAVIHSVIYPMMFFYYVMHISNPFYSGIGLYLKWLVYVLLPSRSVRFCSGSPSLQLSGPFKANSGRRVYVEGVACLILIVICLLSRLIIFQYHCVSMCCLGVITLGYEKFSLHIYHCNYMSGVPQT